MQQALMRSAIVLAALLTEAAVSGQETPAGFRLLNEFPAAEATQAVAVDDEHFYAIANSSIGKYRRSNGEKVAEWQATEEFDLRHLNSGIVIDGKLYCCNSNFPKFPEVSSVEVFSTATLEHSDTHSFGIYEGSLTWIDRRDNSWWAVFAHYSEKVNENQFAKPHTYTSLVQFDNRWRRVAGWIFPDSVLERFAPHSCSGGFWGPDGKLYCSGHDLGEIYVLSIPKAGSVLKHERTIAAPITGQGIAWPTQGSVFYGINRPKRLVVEFEIDR
jgi:hypothetical protein